MAEYVLIADDDKIARLIHTNLLKNKNSTIVEAKNGKEAVQQFLIYRDQIKIILMDFNMPEINGAEATQEIRHIEKALRIKPSFIIGITANTTPQVKAFCLKAGMNAVIYKPATMEQLSPYFTIS